METSNDGTPITVSPFDYNPTEWSKHPKVWLEDYVKQRKLPKYEVYYKDYEHPDFGGYCGILILDDRAFLSPTYYMTTDIAKSNVIILVLLNIVGYCETAEELQSGLYKLLQISNSPINFATNRPKRAQRSYLSKSLDSCGYTDEVAISFLEIKENIRDLCDRYRLNINNTGARKISAILKEDYYISVSRRSINMICSEIRRDDQSLHIKYSK